MNYKKDSQRKDEQKSNESNFDKYYSSGFFENKDKNIIRKDLLDQNASEIAKKVIGEEREKLTSSQLRRFYHDAKSIERRLDIKIKNKGQNEEEVFKEFLPEIKMIKAKVAYTANPKKAKIPQQFKNFLTSAINKVEDYKDFKAFLKHFEAVVGYIYGEEGFE